MSALVRRPPPPTQLSPGYEDTLWDNWDIHLLLITSDDCNTMRRSQRNIDKASRALQSPGPAQSHTANTVSIATNTDLSDSKDLQGPSEDSLSSPKLIVPNGKF